MLKVHDNFNREIKSDSGETKYLPEVLTFDTYKASRIVKNWIDIVDWHAEIFERLCEISHFDSDNM